MKRVTVSFFVLFLALTRVSAQGGCNKKSAPNKLHFEFCLDNGWTEDVTDIYKFIYRDDYPSNKKVLLSRFPEPMEGMSLMACFKDETDFLLSGEERSTLMKTEMLPSLGDSALYVKQKIETLKKNGKVIAKETMLRSAIIVAHKGKRYYLSAYYSSDEEAGYDLFMKQVKGRVKFIE